VPTFSDVVTGDLCKQLMLSLNQTNKRRPRNPRTYSGQGDRVRRALVTVAALSAANLLSLTLVTTASAQMALAGKLDVSAGGAATYEIPIAVPPGTAGMAPSLTLSYSSQGGNGIAGVGWSLSGLLSIGRCSQTFVQDGVRGAVTFASSDRFCLDGQRLVAISGSYGADGTEYRTEVDSFSRIISHGTAGTGPSWFEVHTKSGQIMEFGHTTDSLVLAQGKTTARNWALNKVSDTKSNYLTVTYTNDTTNGQAYPIEIDYTGNTAASLAPYNKVQFLYATRPDISPMRTRGSLVRTTVRLTDIKTYAGTTLVSDYKLAYQQSPSTQRSEIASITACTGDGSCFPAMAIGWPTGASGTFTGQLNSPAFGSTSFGSPPGSSPGQTGSSGFGNSGTTYSVTTGDFNGDGISDYMLITGSSQYVFLGNGNGTFTGRLNTPVFGSSNFGAPPTATYSVLMGDFNGDGKTDYMLIAGTIQYVFTSNGDGTFTGKQNTPVMGSSNFGSPPSTLYSVVVGDFNGDGLSDYMLVGGTSQYVFLSNGDGTFTGRLSSPAFGPTNFGSPPVVGWTPPPTCGGFGGCTPNPNIAYSTVAGDFNGDGKTDYMLINGTSQYVFLSNGDGTFTGQLNSQAFGSANFGSPPEKSYSVVVGDFNGDGLTDYMLVAGTSQYVFLSNGDGTFVGSLNNSALGCGFSGPCNFGTPPSANYSLVVGDFNADGKTDYMLLGPQTQYVFTSNGDGTFSGKQNSPVMGASNFGSPPSAAYAVIGGDYNGDGLTDYLLIANTSQYVFLANGPTSDSVSSIANGIGASSAITYQPLTKASVYSKDTNAVYPLQDVQGPINVVSRVDAANGIGGTASTTYKYAGGKSDISGRGFLGFRLRSVTDLQTSIVATTNFRQDFPYLGLTASGTSVLGTQTLNQTTNTYQFSNASGAGTISTPSNTSAPYKVNLLQSVMASFDLDGTTIPPVTTSYQYDAYGNATQVAASTPDGFSKTTTNTYNNDTTHWFLGRLTGASVTSTTP
jgi:hypothetical protein